MYSNAYKCCHNVYVTCHPSRIFIIFNFFHIQNILIFQQNLKYHFPDIFLFLILLHPNHNQLNYVLHFQTQITFDKDVWMYVCFLLLRETINAKLVHFHKWPAELHMYNQGVLDARLRNMECFLRFFSMQWERILKGAALKKRRDARFKKIKKKKNDNLMEDFNTSC